MYYQPAVSRVQMICEISSTAWAAPVLCGGGAAISGVGAQVCENATGDSTVAALEGGALNGRGVVPSVMAITQHGRYSSQMSNLATPEPGWQVGRNVSEIAELGES